jgi:hypothetical protein
MAYGRALVTQFLVFDINVNSVMKHLPLKRREAPRKGSGVPSHLPT